MKEERCKACMGHWRAHAKGWGQNAPSGGSAKDSGYGGGGWYTRNSKGRVRDWEDSNEDPMEVSADEKAAPPAAKEDIANVRAMIKSLKGSKTVFARRERERLHARQRELQLQVTRAKDQPEQLASARTRLSTVKNLIDRSKEKEEQLQLEIENNKQKQEDLEQEVSSLELEIDMHEEELGLKNVQEEQEEEACCDEEGFEAIDMSSPEKREHLMGKLFGNQEMVSEMLNLLLKHQQQHQQVQMGAENAASAALLQQRLQQQQQQLLLQQQQQQLLLQQQQQSVVASAMINVAGDSDVELLTPPAVSASSSVPSSVAPKTSSQARQFNTKEAERRQREQKDLEKAKAKQAEREQEHVPPQASQQGK